MPFYQTVTITLDHRRFLISVYGPPKLLPTETLALLLRQLPNLHPGARVEEGRVTLEEIAVSTVTPSVESSRP
jgi:hypothetical protein